MPVRNLSAAVCSLMDRGHDVYFIYDVGCYVIDTHEEIEEIEFHRRRKFEIDAEFVLLLHRQVKP